MFVTGIYLAIDGIFCRTRCSVRGSPIVGRWSARVGPDCWRPGHTAQQAGQTASGRRPMEDVNEVYVIAVSPGDHGDRDDGLKMDTISSVAPPSIHSHSTDITESSDEFIRRNESTPINGWL